MEAYTITSEKGLCSHKKNTALKTKNEVELNEAYLSNLLSLLSPSSLSTTKNKDKTAIDATKTSDTKNSFLVDDNFLKDEVIEKKKEVTMLNNKKPMKNKTIEDKLIKEKIMENIRAATKKIKEKKKNIEQEEINFFVPLPFDPAQGDLVSGKQL